MTANAAAQRYTAAWRWHFFAGIVVVPFLLVLATSGLIMLYYTAVQTPVGERLRVSIAADAFPIRPGLGIHLTASVGLATLESAEDTPETVFRRADSALFAAKRRGRNRVAANAA